MSKLVCPECDRALPAGSPDGMCPNCLLALGASPDALGQPHSPQPSADAPSATPDSSAGEEPGQRIGRYRLLERIGEGGFGAVWMAEQQEPVRRRVALKILKLGMDTREVVARFEAERQALALMDHPNIARIFDGGSTAGGRPYFVMELVKGVRITEYCDARRLDTHQRLKLFIEVCQAVQHAHQKGIIHRDLKPSNVLVTELDGRAVPKVIDFGIAKATEQSLTEQTLFTRFHQVMGSPAYMSPEQAGLGSLDVDTRSDIYSLGVLLYELLTSRAPFSNEELLRAGLDGALRLIREKEPPRPSTWFKTLVKEQALTAASSRAAEPSKLSRLIRGDLDWVVMKALEKDRNRRYDTATAFARDVQHFLDQEPVTAAAPTLAYRFQKFARRNRLALATGAAFSVVVTVAAMVSTREAIRARQHARSEEHLRRVAETNEAILRQTVYSADMTLAAQALERGDDETARQTLRRYFQPGAHADLRGWDWRHLWHRAQGDPARAVSHHTNTVTAFAFLEGGKRLLSASHDGTIREWDFASGRALRRWDLTGHRWRGLAVHPSGTNLISHAVDEDLMVRVDLLSGTTRFETVAVSRTCYALAASPDGRAYAHGSNGWGFTSTNGVVVIRDADFANPRILPASGSRCAFSSDGKWLATGAWINRIKLWSWPDLQAAGELGPVEGIASLDFSPDNDKLVASSSHGEITLWNVATKTLLQRRNAHGGTTVGSARFSPDGRSIVTAGGDQTIVIRDAEHLTSIRVLRGYADQVWQAGWTPDGQSLVTTTRAAGIRVWPTNDVQLLRPDGVNFARPVHFSSNSQLLAVELANPPGAAVWSVAEGREIARLNGRKQVHGFLPGNERNELLVVEERDRNLIEHRRVPTFDIVRTITLEPPPANSAGGMCRVMSPDGRFIVQCRESGFMSIWDLESGQLRKDFEAHRGGVRKAVFSRDGRWLLSCGADQVARLWDAARFEPVKVYAGDASISWEIAFSADSKLVAVGWLTGSYRVFDRATGQLRAMFQAIEDGLAALPGEGQTLITLSANRSQLRFWNLPSNREAGTLSFDLPAGQFVTLSPDETMLVGETRSRTLLLWRAPGLESVNRE